MALLTFTDSGIYCEAGDFFIDPWKPVQRAVITHAHADHARAGMKHYLAHPHTIAVMRHRLGHILAQALPYGKKIRMRGVTLSLHPAGHAPGSSQIKVSCKGETWVVSGDYKLQSDGFSEPFEPVVCQHFVTESTFGLPVYRWAPQAVVSEQLNHWWQHNAALGKASVLLGYSFGKAQRLLSMVDPTIGPIYVHGAVHHINEVLRQQGYTLPPTTYCGAVRDKARWKGALIVAPPSALGSAWMKQFTPYSTALASGWMALRGARRRRNADVGLVLSDHADFDRLNQGIQATTATNIYVTHGYSDTFSKWLRAQGYQAQVVKTEYEGELAEMGEASSSDNELNS